MTRERPPWSERQVWKFPLILTDEQPVTMPLGAQALRVDVQGLEIMLWAEVTPDNPPEVRQVIIKGTGHNLPRHAHRRTYVGSVESGPFVWHVFLAPGAVD